MGETFLINFFKTKIGKGLSQEVLAKHILLTQIYISFSPVLRPFGNTVAKVPSKLISTSTLSSLSE